MRVELSETLRRSPRQAGLPRSRWWLAGIRQAVPGLAAYSLSGVHGVLRRFGLYYKRGRQSVHSPDADYDLKLAYIAAAQQQAQQAPHRIVMLYEDELTYYRRPSVAQAYARCGQRGWAADTGWKSNTKRRVAAVLNIHTGQVIAWQRSRFDRRTLIRFYAAVERAYPQAERIFIVLDNWPVHFHPEIVLAFQDRKITFLRLPTYAPWTNPVEKVWWLLKKDVLHLHDFGDDWSGLQRAVHNWLERYSAPSPALLCSLGLCPP